MSDYQCGQCGGRGCDKSRNECYDCGGTGDLLLGRIDKLIDAMNSIANSLEHVAMNTEKRQCSNATE